MVIIFSVFLGKRRAYKTENVPHDGALECDLRNFAGKSIGYRRAVGRLPRSPNLMPLNFILWTVLKDLIVESQYLFLNSKRSATVEPRDCT